MRRRPVSRVVLRPPDLRAAYDRLPVRRPGARSRLAGHGEAMLTGAGDSATGDHGRLRATPQPGSGRDLTAGTGRPPTPHARTDSTAPADRETACGAGAGRIP
ncbi:hypothetical protein [Streptomyces sp. NPDC048521]|uniref:hypothetical protein n=1 Tax=Streptomyces sp. NPDC048521 TaxID=3365566 RepID=UPI00371E5F6E